MLGWLIVVRVDDDSPVAAPSDDDPTVLARWAVGLGGTEWLTKLVADQKAKQTLFAGYPNRFVAVARDVLPSIEGGPPPYEQLPRGSAKEGIAGWIGQVQLFDQRIAACAAETRLTIDAWDQS